MNVVLAYYHLQEDWEDEKKISSLFAKGLLNGKVKKIIQTYPRQSKVIAAKLKELSALEKEKCMDLDKVAGCFGELMAELFVYRQDMWEERLRNLGFYLGKYIYLMDAYDDLEKDIKENCYNPLKEICEKKDYEERMKEVLCMMIAECCAEFEKLPCLVDVDILRNILYDGVWGRYRAIQEKRMKGKEQKNV